MQWLDSLVKTEPSFIYDPETGKHVGWQPVKLARVVADGRVEEPECFERRRCSDDLTSVARS